MSMTRRDSEAVAEAVAEAKRRVEYERPVLRGMQLYAATEVLEIVTRELSTACARQHKGGLGFNRDKFVEACGFPEA